MRKSPCVYRFFTADDQLLYVGCTTDLPTRLYNHRATQPWWTSVTRIDIQHFADLGEALAAEETAIKTEAPTHSRYLQTDKQKAGAIRNYERAQALGRGDMETFHSIQEVS